jgi:arginase
MRQGTRRVTLIGAPVDLGSGGNGSAAGPAALRSAGLAEALRQRGYDVTDRRDIAGIVNSPGLTIDGCRHLKEIAANSRLVRDAVAASLAGGELPLLMGGDHSLAIGSLAAVARHCARLGKPLFVLWLDAHADFNTPASSPTGKIYGMPVAVAAGEGHRALTGIGHAVPMVELGHVTQIGVRSVDPLEAVRVRERGLRVHDMAEVRARGMRPIVDEVLAEVHRQGGHLHVSFDIDFLDPSVAPGVGLAEPDGPTFEEAESCMATIAASGLLGSMDVVEMNPGCDPSGQTARRVVALTERAFADARARAAAE